MIVDEMNIEATTIKIYDDYVDETTAYRNLDLVVKALIDKYMIGVQL